MAKRTSKSSSRARSSGVRRPQVVWASLVGAMTVVGGLLFAVDNRPVARMDAVSLPALVASAGSSTMEAVFKTRTKLDKQRWTSIVIYHSGSPSATPQRLEAEARAKNLDGMGYHFVIGNGNGSFGDGEIHIGNRWLNQKAGAHAAGPKAEQFNRTAIGICLVGQGDRQPFTANQLRYLTMLVDALAQELNIPKERIFLHSDIAPTSDPGRFFPAEAFKAQIAAALKN